jgi:hypothetical protein
MNMLPDEYLQERVDDQINWFDGKGLSNQRCFKSLRITEIVSAAIIPFMVAYSDAIPYGKIIVGSLGMLIAISAGIATLNQYQENWLMYRTTCEALRHEKFLFITKTKPYAEENAFEHFVSRIENLISKENAQWAHVTKKKPPNKTVL